MSLPTHFRLPHPGFFASVLLAAALLAGCKEDAKKGTVLAQVGSSSLTLEELRESFPAEYEQLIRREQYLDFIKRWIDDEVIYQQALKNRMDDDPQVKRRVDRLTRKLLIEEFLARENPAEAFEPDETAMNQYYEMHKEEFRRTVPEIKYVHLRVQTSKQAEALRWRIQTDQAFITQAAAQSLDPVPESIASLPYKKQSELPPCLAQDAAATRIGANTPPISCPDGTYIVRVLDRLEAGSQIPFAEAKDEISATLLVQRKDKLLDGRIAKYKAGAAISYNLDQIPGLTETSALPAGAGGAPSGVGSEAARPVSAPMEALGTHSGPEIDPAPRPKPKRRPAPAAAPAQPADPAVQDPAAPAAPAVPAEPPQGSQAAPPAAPEGGAAAPGEPEADREAARRRSPETAQEEAIHAH